MPKVKKVLESHNNKLHVKKDDTVLVITGKDKGKKRSRYRCLPSSKPCACGRC